MAETDAAARRRNRLREGLNLSLCLYISLEPSQRRYMGGYVYNKLISNQSNINARDRCRAGTGTAAMYIVERSGLRRHIAGSNVVGDVSLGRLA